MSKYGAQPVVIDGRRFASKREAARYQELRLLERAGQIVGLRCQVRYACEVNGQHVCDYVADFVYDEWQETRLRHEPGGDYDGISRRRVTVVEDTKGVRTPVYRLKKRLLKAIHGIEILET